MPPHQIAVIGAGLSGLCASVRMQRGKVLNDINILMLEKSFKVGGRMSSRRMKVDEQTVAVFDHGAQFFTVRHKPFQTLVDDLESSCAARIWSVNGFEDCKPDGHARWIGARGMLTIPTKIATDLALSDSVQIELESHVQLLSISRAPDKNGTEKQMWSVTFAHGGVVEADGLVLTMPGKTAIFCACRSFFATYSTSHTCLSSVGVHCSSPSSRTFYKEWHYRDAAA
jgi:predicted NAD/FAD-dependent oxidoreductase